MVLPPGTILQLMYLRERLGRVAPGRFIEVGPGSGEISQLLLDCGWQGTVFDLDALTIKRLKERFSRQIEQGRFEAINADYLSFPIEKASCKLVISCMVLEHLDDRCEGLFLGKSCQVLAPSGLMIGLVPAGPKNWGIEDEIAGHYRRYTRTRLFDLFSHSGWTRSHIAGLTFPLSNALLPISNFLVRRAESNRLGFSELEKTKFSGRRNVSFKTHFPSILGLFLNPYVLYPLHLLQKFFRESDRSLVLYFEAQPQSSGQLK